MITLKLTNDQINQLKADYHNGDFRYDIDYTQFQVKKPGIVITIYTSNKAVFSGPDAKKHALAYGYRPSDEEKPPKPTFPMAGSDEVGTGDYFGPVVVCAAYVDEEDLTMIPVEDIVDSKQINDADILRIGPILTETLKYSLLILDNEKYNSIHNKYNMNAIKSLLHNQTFNHLDKKVTLPKDNVIIDQFTPKNNYYKFLENESKIYKDLTFVTKAENKYLAVACAAIIARYAFLMEFEKMEMKYQLSFPKGAGVKVDRAGVRFVEKYGLNNLQFVAKTHFKNTEKIKNLLTTSN